MNPSMSKRLCLFACLAMFLATPLGFADEGQQALELEPKVKKPTPFDYYVTDMGRKFDRGAENFLMGWTDVIAEPMRHHQEAGDKNRFLNGAKGVGEGLLKATLKTFGGFVDMITAPLPKFKTPLPDDGVDLKKVTGPFPQNTTSTNSL